jgi:ABC-2 type transport system permease protein
MRRYLSLFLDFMKQNIKSMLEYRIDFIIDAISSLVERMVGLTFIWIIFNNAPMLDGWNYYEVTFIYGFLAVVKGINHIFFDNLWALGNYYIREGQFDIILVRPISPLFHLLANKIQQKGIGGLLIGLVILIKSANEIGIGWSLFNIVAMIFFILCATAIFSGVELIVATSAFWVVRSFTLMWPIFSLNEFVAYPLTIYNKGIRFFLSVIIPYAFISFYPANFFMDKGFQSYSLLTPVVAIIVWFISIKVWKFGLSNYSSTGS